MNNNDSPKRNPTDEEMRLIVAPFARWNTETMNHEISEFIREAGLQYDEESIRRGAKLAQDENAFKRPRDALEYRDNEEEYLRSEAEGTGRDKFKQTWTLYSLVFVCSIGAAVQGWDESAVSSAQIYFQYALDIQGTTLGLVNAAPYLCCAITCWLNHPLNKLFGRRGTIFIACFVSFVTCLGQGFVQTWQQLFVARLLLGFGIGPKSATIPVFAAECAPANIRGALVMMWQMWTAAGIMFGYVAGVALHAISDGSDDKCHALGYYSYNYNGSVNSTIQSGVLPPRPPAIDPTNIHLKNVTNTEDLLGTNCSLNWRMMLAAPMILPLVVMAYIYTVPESPRWLLQKAHDTDNPNKKLKYRQKAWASLCRLRHTRLQAARDLFLIHHLLKNEKEIFGKQNGLKQLFTQPRSRRALLASVIVMFLQQFCGVNVHVYYSVSVFYEQAKYSATQALLLGMGFGIINFVFALPAVFTIDTFGRRNLLLSTFPFMAIFQAFIAIALAADSSNRPLLLVGMYLFAVAYSPGEGPVPFVYSAESMPLYNRDLGMGIATAVLWLFNGVLAITYPQFLKSFTPAGTFGWYAAWCGLGWFMILLFVPETKDLTLEELDKVFSLKTSKHMAHGIRQFNWFVKRYLLWQRFAEKPILVHPGEHPEEADIFEVGSNLDRSSIGGSEVGLEVMELRRI